MLVYATLIVCAVAVALVVYRYDLYDREPWFMVLLSVGAGAIGMWLAGKAQVYWLLRSGPDALEDTVLIAALAGTHEELAKFLVVLLVAFGCKRYFNDPMDGVIYGSFAGLGAAIEESFDVLRQLAPGTTLPGTEPVRLLGHLVMGGIGGFGLGLARFRVRWWKSAVPGAFGAAVLLHFLWDIVAVPINRDAVSTQSSTFFSFLLMVAGLLMYGGCVVLASRCSRSVLDPGSDRRLTGWPFRAAPARGADVPGSPPAGMDSVP